MTTIAFRNGVVASDSRLSQGDNVMPEFLPKVWVSKTHPVIYAGCGMICDWYAAARVLDRMEVLPWDDQDWAPNPFLDLDDATLMVITRAGDVYYLEGKGYYPCTAPFFAMGSGAVAARAAMYAGATAEQAVEIACRLDTGSALPVHIKNIVDIPLPARTNKRKRAA